MSEPVDTLRTGARCDADWAFDRYEAIRPRLPAARFAPVSVRGRDLRDVAERYDGFVLDAFGVLNIGETAIVGAVARMADLRAQGKRLVVLTNGATQTRAQALAKYCALGFDFSADEVVSSRDVAAAHLERIVPGGLWGAASGGDDSFHDIPARLGDMAADPTLYQRADGFVLLSSARWNATMQARLAAALTARPRPLVVANPDLVAPREQGLSLEPGAYAHDLADRLDLQPAFFGKPYPGAFAEARARLGGIAPDRIAMVGDTLHTDILGGRAAGFATVLITRHGLFAGRDVAPYIARSGIRPDVILETT